MASKPVPTEEAKPSRARTPRQPALRGHFIPNSHLDREWTLEYQQTRRLTVEFLDALLDIFDQVPEYTFLLDSQTVPLEDYLQIRPENEARVRAVIEAGRMTIGPWYTAPDCNTITGESIVRNLLVGDRTARRYGRPMKTGYTPFGFGQVSQLPQIYAGFGIPVVFFYRGITNHEAPESEFVWESPDGTRLVASRFGTKARYNFFVDVWRPVAYGRTFTDRLLDWRRGGMPIKRVTEDREHDHYFIQQSEKKINRDVLEECFRKLLETERKHFTTPVIPLMQGMDTTRPDPMEAEIVRELQAFLQPGEEVFFSTLEEYANDLLRHLDPAKLRRLKGEMRNCGAPHPDVTGLEHIVSGRVRQKIAQHNAERMLTRLAEPFSALVWAFGEVPYPKTSLDLGWRYLLHCHPHDTVAGCGIDKLETDAMYRLDQVRCLSDIMLDDALAAMVTRIDTSHAKPDELVLTVFNPSPRPRTEVIDAYLDFSETTGIIEYEVVDANGRQADFTFVHRKRSEKTVRDNCDLTMALVGWMCKTQIVAENVPAMGWKTYIVRKCAPLGRKERIALSPTRMENEHLAVEFAADGTLTLTEKSSGRTWSGLHEFTDNGENGTGWEHRPTAIDSVFSSKGQKITISLEENTALSATIRVAFTLRVPSGRVHNDTYHYSRRGDAEADIAVESFFTLRKGARRLDVKTVIDNGAKNHRLRVLFPTGLAKATHSTAEQAFDVVQRVIDRGPEHSYSQAPNPQHPMLRFVDVSDGKAGLAILTQGLHEYEVTDDPSRTIAVTLLRAYEVTLCTVSWRWERRPDQELSQVPGKVVARYAIVPHDGNYEKGAVVEHAEDFQLPLVSTQSSANRRGGPWGLEGSLAQLAPASLALSAIKKAEDRETLVVRIHNPTTKKETAKLTFPSALAQARALNMNEDAPDDAPAVKRNGATLTFDVGPKKIITIEATFEKNTKLKAQTAGARKKPAASANGHATQSGNGRGKAKA
ncbi:MAG: 2-O-(6-phospho-alpha-D-mannosyl)-D-glycerate hydrolase [Candidatus Sumerlaeota bacterium]|nr:2-O-(6-phospho-alpha-D-mannosyl)-D-glycerate hydrolase [Candidatus Sumerlaeota bacterium]